MGGFGSGSFGSDAFGAWGWSRYALWDQIPEVYRLQDADYGNHLEKLINGYRRQFDAIRGKVANLPDIRDPFAVRTQYDETRVLRLGPSVERRGMILQRGVDGYVNASRYFVAESARFRVDDVGAELRFLNSQTPANNTPVRIARVIDVNTVVTDPILLLDTTKARWELREYLEEDPGIVTVQVREGYVNEVTPGWIVFDGFSDFEVLGRRLFPILTESRNLFTDADGSDGYIDTSNRLVVNKEILPKDIGKKVAIKGLEDPNLDGYYEIVEVEGALPWALTLDVALPTDQGPLFWAMYPFPELDLGYIGDPPKGVVEQEGEDAETTATTIYSDSARFTTKDVGKEIRLLGSSSGNDGPYNITGVASINEVVVDPAPPVSGETALTWRMRNKTNYGDNTQVQIRASSMIKDFVRDFGIEIDSQESEQFQRWQAYHVPQWIKYKAHDTSYEVLGLLSGVLVEVGQLYRITPDWYDTLIASGIEGTVLTGETDPGRFGTQGGLYTSGGRLYFTAPDAAFRAADVGRSIYISNAVDSANNKLYTIDLFISATEVRLDFYDEIVGSEDYGVGGSVTDPQLRWAIVRLYASVARALPNYDDFVPDLMEEIITYTGGTFSVDRFCWDNLDTDVPVIMVSAAFVSEGVWEVTVETPLGQPGSANVVLNIGSWAFFDTYGTEYFLDSVPVDIGGDQYTFLVKATSSPQTGGGEDPYLSYVCEGDPDDISCDWCPSYRMLVTLTLGPELAGQSGLEVENVFERVLRRLEEAKPDHVEMLPVMVQTVTTNNLELTATVETP